MSEIYKEYSFLELTGEKEIEIPIIQRDYAQGRLQSEVNELRENFLSALTEKLQSPPDQKRLILDFVYGSTNTTEEKKLFIPLDGQQRLTTLFLLHWYLCPEAELSCLRKGKLSRFSYQTRISSRDFCHRLVTSGKAAIDRSIEREKQSIDKKVAEAEKASVENASDKERLQKEAKALQKKFLSRTFSQAIKNEPWFMWSWQKDPTVKAMLVMLDAIDDKLRNVSEQEKLNMWNNLKQGQVAFHLLPLEEFGLTNELYVKMNARGKELSAFDIFKSTLEEQMRLNQVSETVREKWRKNVDSCWIDIFWNRIKNSLEETEQASLSEKDRYEKKRELVDSVEDSYLRFLRRMMVFHLFQNELEYTQEQTRYLPRQLREEDTVRMEHIRDYSVREDVLKLMPFFIKTRFFGESFFRFVIHAMEALIWQDENNRRREGTELIQGVRLEIKEDTLFGAFISQKVSYETRIQFYALILFLVHNPAEEIVKKETLQTQLKEWMRIVRNLSTITNVYSFNTSSDFGRALKSLQKWTADIYEKKLYPSLNDLFASDEKLDGFAGFQLEEEHIKAQLLADESWKAEIRKIEEHPYFLGQISFLLRWSQADNGSCDIDKFREYGRKAGAIFEEGGLKKELREEDSHLFRNAMMCTHAYYLRGNSFVNSVEKHRDNSWKRYLRDEAVSEKVKVLLDLWEEEKHSSVVDFCRHVIACNSPSDWRKCFIEYPQIYKEMSDHCLGIWDREREELALLSKTRWSSRHKELKTFYWSLKYGADHYYHSHHGEYPFCAVFCKDAEIEDGPEFSVDYVNNGYLVISCFDPGTQEMVYNNEKQWWESYFPSVEADKAEGLLEKLKEEINKIE